MKPIWRLYNGGGGDITEFVQDALLSISLTDKTGIEHDELDLEIGYGSKDNGFSEKDIPPEGTKFQIALGYDNVPDGNPKYNAILYKLGTFVINDITTKGAETEIVTLKCHGYQFSAGIQTQRKDFYEGLTMKQMLTRIATRNGATLVYDPDIRDPALPRVDQIDETDQAFVRRIAESLNLVGKFTDTSILYFGRKGLEKSLTGKFIPTVTLSRNQVVDYTHNKKTSNEVSGVTASWLETDNPPNNTYTAGDDSKTTQTLNETYSTEQEAKQAADSTLDKLKSNEDTLSLTTIGDPRIQADSKVTITGFPKHIPTEWRANTVKHSFDASNATYQTEITCESIHKVQESTGLEETTTIDEDILIDADTL